MTIKGQRSEVRSCAIETRTDVRTPASILKFYLANDKRVSTLSGLISAVLEDFLSILEENKLVERIKSTEEAKRLLESYTGRATYRRGERMLIKQMSAESLKIDDPTPAVAHESILPKADPRTEQIESNIKVLLGEDNG